jgi:hypothetical protein
VTSTSPASSSDPVIPVTGPTLRAAPQSRSSLLVGSRVSSGRAGGGSDPLARRQGHQANGSKVRASRWYEHQEALGLRRLGDAPLELTGSPTPSSPSPGRRHESPRGMDLRSCQIPDLRFGWAGGGSVGEFYALAEKLRKGLGETSSTFFGSHSLLHSKRGHLHSFGVFSTPIPQLPPPPVEGLAGRPDQGSAPLTGSGRR